jgi:Fur family ferric uptake transcriptional regulator
LVRRTADDLIAGLRSQGLRVTAARRAVCAVLAESDDEHLTAAQIHERAAGRAGAVDVSTVYRTIEVLHSAGLLSHVDATHVAGIVHLTDPGHHHLICQRCGRAVDVSREEVREVSADLAVRHGFAPDSLRLSLTGLCEACAAQA